MNAELLSKTGQRRGRHVLTALMCACSLVLTLKHPVSAADGATAALRPSIVPIDPPEKNFFTKKLDFHGMPIKSSDVVSDEAL